MLATDRKAEVSVRAVCFEASGVSLPPLIPHPLKVNGSDRLQGAMAVGCAGLPCAAASLWGLVVFTLLAVAAILSGLACSLPLLQALLRAAGRGACVGHGFRGLCLRYPLIGIGLGACSGRAVQQQMVLVV